MKPGTIRKTYDLSRMHFPCPPYKHTSDIDHKNVQLEWKSLPMKHDVCLIFVGGILHFYISSLLLQLVDNFCFIFALLLLPHQDINC